MTSWPDLHKCCVCVALLLQVKEEQQILRRDIFGFWLKEDHVVRHAWRETPWCLQDASQTSLPVIQGQRARQMTLEVAGQALHSSSSSKNLQLVLSNSLPLIAG